MPFAVAATAISAVGLAASIDSGRKASNTQNRAIDAQTQAADDQAQIARDQLDFNKKVYDDGAPLRSSAEKRAQETSDAQLKGMQFAMDQAKDYQDYNNTTFRPLEKGLVSDAQGYDTAQRRADAAASAQADVDQSFDATKAATARDLGRSGVAPGDAKSMSLMQDAAIAQAATRAGAGTTAMRNVEQQGYARKVDAASLGRNLPSNQATQQQISQTAGNGAVANGMQGLVAQQAGVAGMNSGFAGASSANSSAGSMFGQIGAAAGQQAGQVGQAANSFGKSLGDLSTNGQAKSWLGGLFSGNGTAGMPTQIDDLGIASDENIKTRTGEQEDPEAALEGLNALPVEKGWKYDPAKGGPNDGGQPHSGPMAQQVKKHLGSEAAPDGKTIDVATMNGKLIAGMQELTKKVNRLEKKVKAH